MDRNALPAAGKSSAVRPILGTMTFGAEGQVRPAAAGAMLRSFSGSRCALVDGQVAIDTARIYQQATPDGDTETVLGDAFSQFPSLGSRATVATKANPMMAPHFSLSRASVIEQCEASLAKLGLDCVDLFYLHSPDIKTDIEDTLSGVEQLHKDGKILEFGLSNFPAWAIVDIWYRCKRRGMVLPTVYQGMYNVLTRDMEREIVPVAREFGLRLYMYNPLAGGLLAGRYAGVEDLKTATTGRFSTEFDRAFGDGLKAGTGIYRSRYSKQPLFEAVDILRKVCCPPAGSTSASEGARVGALVEDTDRVVNGVRVRVQVTETTAPAASEESQRPTMASVALRWLIHHSLLRDGDGVILGVSRPEQLVANLAAWHAGPLPPEVVEACDAAWQAARPACEAYFRGYGAEPGGVERFLALKRPRPLSAGEEAAEDEDEEGEAKKAK
eukprot:TRINITY_DN47689_c0_g1_i1.p1 TRINITY_DN47689_c0_g1~~TRINITY_DN47689_c0_g1_i1.p1  ORF type:complete len:441 (+),score=102.53 TRINITY_DN47689_c0_g1_i1:55-1377(+)